MRPLLEVRPGPLSNKGGHLMLLAVAAELGGDYRLAVEPWIGPYETRSRLGLYQRLSVRRLGPASEVPAGLMPSRIRQWLGVVTEREVAGIVNVAGFAYGDQVGPEQTERAAAAATRWRQAGKRVVLLPQAFGPFTGPRIRTAASTLIDRADLVFARDKVSLAALHDLGSRTDHVAIAPDFTNALAGASASDVASPSGGAADPSDPLAYVVPNMKVVKHGDAAASTVYLSFLTACIRAIESRGVRPVILLHETREDGAIAGELRAAAGGAIEIVGHEDPLILKGMIGRSRLVVGSRFHALVSALSQAVPVIAVGWSHKYAELLEDYGVGEALVSLPADQGVADAAVARALDEPARGRSVDTLGRAAANQLELTREMWRRVRQVLPGSGASVGG